MQYRIFTVGLKRTLFSWCEEYFSKKSIELRNVPDINEVVHLIEKESFHLLVLDLDYLRNIGQVERLQSIRYSSFIPMVVLSETPEYDISSVVEYGADVCIDSNLQSSYIAPLLLAQLRRYTTYNCFDAPEMPPFQVGDIAIDPSRHLVWVCNCQVKLLPREFSLLLYFMQNPRVVLTPEQICKHAWKKEYPQDIAPSIHNLRQAIEPDPTNPIYIKTVYRVGYCFTGYFSEICDK